MNFGPRFQGDQNCKFRYQQRELDRILIIEKDFMKKYYKLAPKISKISDFCYPYPEDVTWQAPGLMKLQKCFKKLLNWILLLFFSRFSSITGVGIIPKMPLTLEGQVWLTMYLLSKSLSKLRLTCLNTMGSLRNYVTQDIGIVELPYPMSHLVTIRLESPPSFHTPKIDKLRAENELSLDANFRSHIC